MTATGKREINLDEFRYTIYGREPNPVWSGPEDESQNPAALASLKDVTAQLQMPSGLSHRVVLTVDLGDANRYHSSTPAWRLPPNPGTDIVLLNHGWKTLDDYDRRSLPEATIRLWTSPVYRERELVAGRCNLLEPGTGKTRSFPTRLFVEWLSLPGGRTGLPVVSVQRRQRIQAFLKDTIDNYSSEITDIVRACARDHGLLG